jgi:hypothetical protein
MRAGGHFSPPFHGAREASDRIFTLIWGWRIAVRRELGAQAPGVSPVQGSACEARGLRHLILAQKSGP